MNNYEPDESIIDNPPYPNLDTTAPSLARTLSELRDWVEGQIPFARWAAEEFGHPSTTVSASTHLPEFVPTEHASVLQMVSLTDLVAVLRQVRLLREQWDSVVRQYETDWLSKTAVAARLQLVAAAVNLLQAATRTPEEWQAISQKARKEQQAFLDSLLSGGIADPESVVKGFDLGRIRPSEN